MAREGSCGCSVVIGQPSKQILRTVSIRICSDDEEENHDGKIEMNQNEETVILIQMKCAILHITEKAKAKSRRHENDECD